MQIIKISEDNEISVHDFPEGTCSEQNQVLRGLIGTRCDLFECVMPKRLYTELGASNRVCEKAGACVVMLVDEEGLYHGLKINKVGSFLYETDKHGCVIAGNILFIGQIWGKMGIDFCGMASW